MRQYYQHITRGINLVHGCHISHVGGCGRQTGAMWRR